MINKFLKKNIKKMSGIALIAVSVFTFINLFNSNNVSFAQAVESCSFLVCSDPTANNADEVTTDITETDLINPDTNQKYDEYACEYHNCDIYGAIEYRTSTVYSPDDISCSWNECPYEGAENSNYITDDPNTVGCRYYICNDNDPPASNYSPTLTTTDPDEVGCIYTYRCHDVEAANYDPTGVEDNDLCQFINCQNPEANNYGENEDGQNVSSKSYGTITGDEDVCTFTACVDSTSENHLKTVTGYDVSTKNPASVTHNSNVCEYIYNCHDTVADNYSSEGVADNSLCEFTNCQNGAADNNGKNENGIDVSSKAYGTIIEDESLCTFTACIDNTAVNHQQTVGGYSVANKDPASITHDEGICIYAGCTDLRADNDGNHAYTNNTLCEVEICQNSIADNYRENAEGVNIDEGSSPYMGQVFSNPDLCTFTACTDPNSETYLQTANGGDVSGEDPNSITSDPSICTYIEGCRNSNAFNYDSDATQDDGSCQYFLCTDNLAISYNNEIEYTTNPALKNTGCSYNQCSTNPNAINYNQTTSDPALREMCITEGCTDFVADNDGVYTISDNTQCEYTACVDNTAVNNLETATGHDVSGVTGTVNSDPNICEYAGCTDIEADNDGVYDVTDNTQCTYTACTDQYADNTDQTANGYNISNVTGTVESNLAICTYTACVDNTAVNNLETATGHDVSNVSGIVNSDVTICLFEGCTDIEADNDDEYDISDNTQCEYSACTDVGAENYNLTATNYDVSGVTGTVNSDPNICEYAGCTDIEADNDGVYDVTDNTQCTYTACTDSDATNYNRTATNYPVPVPNAGVSTNNSFCEYVSGCTDPSAYNYDIAATQDNNSCYWRYTCEQSGYSNSWIQTTQNEWEIDANCVE